MKEPLKPIYRTKLGVLYEGDSSLLLESSYFKPLKNKVNLIFTSPPFPLNKKKAYGNLTGQQYIEWLSDFGPIFKELLAPNGSLVIELGNAWEPGVPTMSLLSLEALIGLKKSSNFHLCQEFIWNNTTKLPSPAEWVTVRRIRVKDAFTKLWWLSPTINPKADNRRILKEYSPEMKALIKRKKYNSGVRPSEHRISKEGFLKDNSGAIPSNVISLPNTKSNDPYLCYCKQNGLKHHPARMPIDLAKFFIEFLTEPGDLILDPFGGSNVTGFVAEQCGRKWRSVEMDSIYAESSISRFESAWKITRKNCNLEVGIK